MALTQEQWFLKLKSFVPSWYFENENLQKAHFMALAKVLSDIQLDCEANLARTFIMTSTDPDLDLLGSERGVDRTTDELDVTYRTRIQSFANQSNKPAIKALVDALLKIGECTILEDHESGHFCGRSTFASRDQYLFEHIYNSFIILVEKQLHSPYSFNSRSNFLSRSDFVGSIETTSGVFDPIISAVDKAKAFGILYRVLEKMGA